MEIIKENMKVENIITSQTGNYNFEWDTIVPDYKPDVGLILAVKETSEIKSKELMQNRAMINGILKFEILYNPYDSKDEVKSIEAAKDFSYIMELPGLQQNMNLNVISEIKNKNISILNSRKLGISCNVEFFGTVTDMNDINYLSDIEDDNVFCKTTEINTIKSITESNNYIEINENLELPIGKPSINEIIKSDIKIIDKDVRTLSNKIIVKGEVEFSGIYNSEIEGNKIHSVVNKIPFTEIFDIQGVNEITKNESDFVIKNPKIIIKENSENENRIINLSCSISVNTKCYECVKLNALTDAFSQNNNIVAKFNEYQLDELINELSGEFSIKDIVQFDNTDNILKIVDFESNAYVNKVYTNENKVNIDGEIRVKLLYMSDSDNKICYREGMLPFSTVINCDNILNDSVVCELKLELVKCSYNIISSNQIEIRAILEYNGRLKKNCSYNIISDVSFDNNKIAEYDNKGIVVYFCNDNESLWDIAKKYRISPQKILKINNIEENAIHKGTKLLII